ncbi:MAG: hypothetical protein V4857_24265 [Pseudomonadota bacterium]
MMMKNNSLLLTLTLCGLLAFDAHASTICTYDTACTVIGVSKYAKLRNCTVGVAESSFPMCGVTSGPPEILINLKTREAIVDCVSADLLVDRKKRLSVRVKGTMLIRLKHRPEAREQVCG